MLRMQKQDNEYEISLMTNLSEARGHHVAGGLGGAVTNVGHQVHPLELPSHPVVNTLQQDNNQSAVAPRSGYHRPKKSDKNKLLETVIARENKNGIFQILNTVYHTMTSRTLLL